MLGYDDYSQPALSPASGGALTGPIAQPQPQRLGILSDPTTAALMSMAGSLLSAGTPSPVPMPIGAAFGNALTNGVNAFGAAQRNNFQNQLAQAHIGLLAQQARKAQLDADLTNQMMQGGGLNGFNDPDKMEALGARLAAAGHPGGAMMIDRAQKLRERQQNTVALNAMRTAPGILGAGVTSGSPQGQALMSNLTGTDPSFDAAVLSAQNEALNSNARPNMPAQDLKAQNPGIYSTLFSSPYVGTAARAAQQVLDTTTGLTPKDVQGEYTRLAQSHEQGQLRQDLANQNADLRRQLAETAQQGRADNRANLQDQRTFQKEQDLSKQYNALAKNFRVVLPQVQAAAQYVAGGKYDSAGDRSLAFQFAKTLDPSDRVGVNDVKDIGKLGNVPERIVQAVQSLSEGKMLPDRVRLEMMQVIRDRFHTMNEQQADIENEYEGRAKNYMLNPRNVVIRYSQRREQSGGGSAGGSGVIDFSKLPKGR